ncbi:MAG: hypothetical protein FJZ60_00155 [Chlamydiae bacterium]|nr:hypothetical protein [Chlamydiota bacterium]
MKIGFSFWGFLTPLEKNSYVNTPDGERGNRVDFVEELLKRGHQVVRLQKQRDDEPYPNVMTDDAGFPDVDVVYCEWRWPTWKNTGTNPSEPDYNRQCEFLDYYHKKGVPIIIHDGDLKMTPDEERRWPNAILSDACVKPRVQTRDRISIPWCNYMKRFFEPIEGSYSYTYVGNNYERDVQFMKYYTDSSKELRAFGIQTTVYGNWLQRSPERKDPRELISMYPHVAFGGRLSYKDIFPAFNSSIAVTHITKDDYVPYGNITGRFFEAIKSGVPALIPNEYAHARPVGLDGDLLVDSFEDVIKKVKWLFGMSQKDRAELVDAQEAALRTVIDPRPEARADLLERVAKAGNLRQG